MNDVLKLAVTVYVKVCYTQASLAYFNVRQIGLHWHSTANSDCGRYIHYFVIVLRGLGSAGPTKNCKRSARLEFGYFMRATPH